MHQTIAAMSFEEFVTLIPVGVLTADEIAEKIGSYRPRSLGGAENLQLAKAIQAWLQAWAGGPPVRGPVRTALRAQSGLAPIPEDAPVPVTDDAGEPL